MFSTVEIATSQGIQNHVLQVQMTAKKKKKPLYFCKNRETSSSFNQTDVFHKYKQ